MSLPVFYRRQVGRDLAAAFTYYEAQSSGLGETFLSAVNSALLSRFPYAVFYRVEVKRVVVLTVLHTARDPKLWPEASHGKR